MVGPRKLLTATLACAALVLSLTAPTPSAAGATGVIRVGVYGGGETLFGGCPDVDPVPVGTDCVETYLIFYREVAAASGGSVGPTGVPWLVYAETYRLTRPDDGEAQVSEFRSGVSADVVVNIDAQHLSSATVTATIPLSDGTSDHFHGSWVATSPGMLFGNDGPANEFPRHTVTDCVTQVSNAHQKFRFATMTGTLNGAPVHSYTFTPFAADIFNNRFILVTSQHGPVCS